jgi:hypothetical protein
MKQRVDEIRGEREGDDAAKDEIGHGSASGTGRPAGVEHHQPEQADAEREIGNIEHRAIPSWSASVAKLVTAR